MTTDAVVATIIDVSQDPYFPPQSPYTPPPVPYFGTPRAASRPDKIASILQFVLGGLIVIAGVLMGVMASIDLAPYLQQLQQQHFQMPAPPPGYTLEQSVHLMMVVMCVLTLTVGITLVILAGFVRRGSKICSILSICVVVIVSLLLGVYILSALVHFANNPLSAVMVLIMFGSVLTLCIATILKLFAGAVGGGTAMSHQQSQYWAAMQHQQQQQPPGYGYGYHIPPVQQNYPPPPSDAGNPPKSA